MQQKNYAIFSSPGSFAATFNGVGCLSALVFFPKAREEMGSGVGGMVRSVLRKPGCTRVSGNPSWKIYELRHGTFAPDACWLVELQTEPGEPDRERLLGCSWGQPGIYRKELRNYHSSWRWGPFSEIPNVFVLSPLCCRHRVRGSTKTCLPGTSWIRLPI